MKLTLEEFSDNFLSCTRLSEEQVFAKLDAGGDGFETIEEISARIAAR